MSVPSFQFPGDLYFGACFFSLIVPTFASFFVVATLMDCSLAEDGQRRSERRKPFTIPWPASAMLSALGAKLPHSTY